MNFSVCHSYLEVVPVCLVSQGHVLSDQSIHILPGVERFALKTVKGDFLKTKGFFFLLFTVFKASDKSRI